jgi:hypothetical protein
MHMDESKPSIPPIDFRLKSASDPGSASECTWDDIGQPPAALAKSDKLVALERQSGSGEIEPCRNDFSDGPSVAVYYRNEEEVSEGFLAALAAMGIAPIDQLPQSEKPPVGRTKP